MGLLTRKKPSHFLAAIVCDSTAYSALDSNYDRVVAYPYHIEQRGWNILRIHTLSWFIQPEQTLNAIHHQLKQWLKADRANDAQANEIIPTLTDTTDASEETPQKNTVNKHSLRKEETLKQNETLKENKSPKENETPKENEMMILSKESHSSTVPATLPRYRYFSLGHFSDSISQGKFHNQSYTPTLQSMIDQFIKTEGPIRKDILINRLSKEHGFKRAGNRIHERIQKLCTDYQETIDTNGTYLWPKNSAPDDIVFRKPPKGQNRHIDEIPAEELMSLVNEAQRRQLPKKTLVETMANMLGLKRITQSTHSRLQKIIHEASEVTVES